MSKRKIKPKTARFTLEPDGFSIHTFELSRKLKRYEYHSVKNTLYMQQQNNPSFSGQMYKDRETGNHICNYYGRFGVRIRLEHNKSDSFESWYVRMIINPRKLIDPQSSYLGILPPEEASADYVRDAFAQLFSGTIFENDMDKYQLRRLDLCTNIRCDKNKLFREMVRVLRKLPTPPKYKRVFHDDKSKDQKETRQYNKHYLLYRCGTHNLVIYDKTYQVQENGLTVDYENLQEGVLRFEVQCNRDYLRKVEKDVGDPCTTELLRLMIRESRYRIIDHFSRCFSDDDFAQANELYGRISASRFPQETKTAMCELVTRLQRVQTVDRALYKMKASGYDTDSLLDKFERLGISPIPLWQNFCADRLPGPVRLLRSVSGGNVAVQYHKVKYK